MVWPALAFQSNSWYPATSTHRTVPETDDVLPLSPTLKFRLSQWNFRRKALKNANEFLSFIVKVAQARPNHFSKGHEDGFCKSNWHTGAMSALRPSSKGHVRPTRPSARHLPHVEELRNSPGRAMEVDPRSTPLGSQLQLPKVSLGRTWACITRRGACPRKTTERKKQPGTDQQHIPTSTRSTTSKVRSSGPCRRPLDQSTP